MENIQKMITDELSIMATNKNMSTLTIPTLSNRTVSNHLRLAQAKHRNISVRENIQTKSSVRFTKENSLRNAAAYLATITATHYMIAPPDPCIKKTEEATEGAQLLHKLIQKENKGIEIRPILPWYISSTNDTTLVAFEGTATSEKGCV